jgi:PhnB protein
MAKKRPKRASRGKRKAKPKFRRVPSDFHTVTPYLAINGAAEALEWYKKAFGAKELSREAGPDGKLMHGRIKIGDSIVMLSDVFPGSIHKDPRELGAASVTLHVYSNDVDVLWKQAVGAGATVTMQLEDMFWGERYGQLTDPFGHAWSVSMLIPMSRKEMEQKRQETMKMFKQAQHAGSDEPTKL